MNEEKNLNKTLKYENDILIQSEEILRKEISELKSTLKLKELQNNETFSDKKNYENNEDVKFLQQLSNIQQTRKISIKFFLIKLKYFINLIYF